MNKAAFNGTREKNSPSLNRLIPIIRVAGNTNLIARIKKLKLPLHVQQVASIPKGKGPVFGVTLPSL